MHYFFKVLYGPIIASMSLSIYQLEEVPWPLFRQLVGALYVSLHQLRISDKHAAWSSTGINLSCQQLTRIQGIHFEKNTFVKDIFLKVENWGKLGGPSTDVQCWRLEHGLGDRSESIIAFLRHTLEHDFKGWLRVTSPFSSLIIPAIPAWPVYMYILASCLVITPSHLTHEQSLL
jgi:hypothetical protein